MSLFPPVRVVSGFGGGRPLKGGGDFKKVVVDLFPALTANRAVAFTAYPVIPAPASNVIIMVAYAILDTDTTVIGAAPSITLTRGTVGGAPNLTSSMSMSSNAIRRIINAVPAQAQTGAITVSPNQAGLGSGVVANANLAIGALWAGTCTLTVWYVEIPV